MKEERNKRARFVCALAHIDAGGQLHLFEGTCEGTITDRLEAAYLPGLPISGCFRPEGFDQVFSALTLKQKNETSHRGRATKKFAQHLRNSAR
jgi:XTP/dITP diphosphohydrolase